MKKTVKISSILGGQSPSVYFGKQGQFSASVGIDPEFSTGSVTTNKPSGVIVPTRYEKFSSTSLTAAPMWLMNNPKNSLTYEYSANGRLHSYSSVFSIASEIHIGTATSGAGNGAAYYNNYNYLFTPTDVSRYGPLSTTPTLVNNVWTGSTLGTLTALTNTTYPGTYNFTYPNHAPHEHYGKLYFLDFLNGKGMVHFIQTTMTSVEGDTNNGSIYNALTLPLGFYPFDLESCGSDLVIICSQFSTSADSVKQGKASLLFWDCSSTTVYKKVDLPDTLGTALLTHNGVPYIWSGALGRGVRLSRYVGGNQIESLLEITDGTPPPAGAVDSLGNRIIWGGTVTSPLAACGVFAKGFVSPALPADSVNQIARITGTGTLPVVTALKFCQESSKTPIIGWRSDTPAEYGLDKYSPSATYNSVFRSEIFNVGEPFQVEKIRMPLAAAVTTNMSIVPKVYVDDETSSTTLDTINPTNDSGKYNALRYKRINGQHNFFLELTIGGSTSLSVGLPIEAEIEILND